MVAARQLELEGHGAGDLPPQLAHLAVVLDLAGRLLKPDLEEPAALLAQMLGEILRGHAAEQVHGLDLLAHAVASVSAAASSPVPCRATKRVAMGSL